MKSVHTFALALFQTLGISWRVGAAVPYWKESLLLRLRPALQSVGAWEGESLKNPQRSYGFP